MRILQGGKYGICHEVNLVGTKVVGLQGPPALTAVLSSSKLLHMLLCTSGGKHCMEDGPYLHVVPLEVHGRGALGLEVFVLSVVPSARLEDGRTRYHLLVIGGIDGVFNAIRRVIIPFGRFKLVPYDVG